MQQNDSLADCYGRPAEDVRFRVGVIGVIEYRACQPGQWSSQTEGWQ